MRVQTKWTKGGEVCWYLNDQLHRENGPAIVFSDGQSWYLFGRPHRDEHGVHGGPAHTWDDGTQIWMDHGRRHRLDGPAVIHSNGTREWYRDGALKDLKYGSARRDSLGLDLVVVPMCEADSSQ